MKRLLSSIVTIIISSVLMAQTEIDGIYYNLNESDKTAEVTYDKNSTYEYGTVAYQGRIEIPSEVTYNNATYKVTRIGNSAFSSCNDLKSVSIPSSVTSIGISAFSGCGNLASVNIPNGVTSIGKSAFSGCGNLASVNIPNGVTKIESSTFSSCYDLSSINIPSSVTIIEDDAFYQCANLYDVYIDDIGAWCNITFESYSSNPLNSSDQRWGGTLYLKGEAVTNLIIPMGVTSINNYSFYFNSGLKTVTIPNSVKSIGECAFQYCSRLTFISIPNSVTSIGRWAFRECSSLTSISIPNGVTNISEYTFSGCSSLTSVNIPSSVTSIQESAFRECTSLISVDIPNSVTSIQNSAFSECSSLTSVIIPSSVTNIESNAFYKCSSLTSVDIPNGVTNISEYSFSGCSSLTSVDIPSSVTHIASSAFNKCSKLTSITVDKNNSVYDSRDNCNGIIETASNTIIVGCNNTFIPNSVTSIGYGAFDGSGISAITIPNSVTSVGYYAFSNCSSLKTVELHCSEIGTWFQKMSSIERIIIGEEVTKIDESAFTDCKGLKGINIPESVTDIGDNAFSGCTSLPEFDNIRYADTYLVTVLDKSKSEYTIKEETRFIGNNAFNYCEKLTSITIPSSVIVLGYGAFRGCTSLKQVRISDVAAWCNVTKISQSSNPLYYAHNLYLNDELLEDLVIPEGVDKIKAATFYKCTSLKSVTIPNSVTYIGDKAFDECSNLSRVNVCDMAAWCNVQVYDKKANPLYHAHNLYLNDKLVEDLIVPEGVTKIHAVLFQEYDKLKSVSFPKSLTVIEKTTFYGCSGLTSVTIPQNMTSIGEYAFMNCPMLKTVIINSNSFMSNSYSSTFSLANIFGKQVHKYVMDGNVASIGKYAFYNCDSLASVTFPSSVTSIGAYAFTGCKRLTSIISYIISPPSISKVFDSVVYNNAILYVPSMSLELYKTTSGWKDFMNIIPLDFGSSFTLNVIDDNNRDVTNEVSIVWYDTNGNQIGTGNKLNGVDNNIDIYYSVLLDEELGRVYREVKMQKVVSGGNSITCKLEKIDRVILEGRISAVDIDKTTATINVRQMLNGKYEQTYQTQTNEQGVFQIEVFDDVTDIIITNDGYYDVMLHRDGFNGNANIGTIPMNLISGFAIASNINMEKAVATGEEEETTTWTDGLNNIEFSLFNITKNNDITDFTVQGGNVIIRSGADIGDVIRLGAKSKQGIFVNATTEFTIEAEANAFHLQLVEKGGLDALCELSNNIGTSGFLYDSDGLLVSKGSYKGEILEMRHLASGVYTLVSLGRTQLLGSMTHLEDMSSIGLTEGNDYIATRIEIADGVLTEINIDEVPHLDETNIYYTNNNSYFSADKASITAGNYLTLSTYLDFKPEYADKVNEVTLTIDLPDGCQMVENSVMANHQAVFHTVNGNRITLSLNKDQIQSHIRFCIIPTQNKSYTITAMASFDIDGQMQQPVGTAQFESKGLSLSTINYTPRTNITISGTAMGHSEVRIYDNDVLIGKTSSKADGTWSTQCELFKPRNRSFHDIHAKIVTANGMELTSETSMVEYDKDYPIPEKVTMTYFNGWYRENRTVVFDLSNNTTIPTSYPFYHGTDFTFLADFSNNDSTQIKNVFIKVLNTDGTVRTLPAVFDGKLKTWVATTPYPSFSRLPMEVAVEYVHIRNTPLYDEEKKEEMNTLINNMLIEVENAYKDCVLELIEDNDKSISFTATTNGYETKENFKITVLDYEQVKTEYANDLYCHIENDTTDIGFVVNVSDDNKQSIIVWDNLNKAALDISTGDVVHANLSKQRRVVPFLLSAAYGVGMSIWEYNRRNDIITDWRKSYESEVTMQRKFINEMINLLYAKCPDGSYKIKDDIKFSRLKDQISQYKISSQQYLDDFRDVLDKQQLRLKQLCCMKGIASVALSAGALMFKGVGEVFKETGGVILHNIGKAMTHLATGALIEFSSQITANAIGYKLDSLSIPPEEIISNWYLNRSKRLRNEYIEDVQSIKASYSKCKKKDNDNDENNDEQTDDKSDFQGKESTPILDPSGFVYEAVLSNRLEGVTTTCYQQENGEAVVWNAEDYSQMNPLKTDESGFYRWDVPQGFWQVKYEKEGYETTFSEWLPVPPPQLDVNVGMKQNTPPSVTQMRGFISGINIDLSKYMLPASLNERNITVTRNGFDEKGHMELKNEEKDPLTEQTFASKVKFVPESPFNSSDLVVVTVHKEVESYCGVNMVKDHVETVKIEPDINSIVTDSVITIPYQSQQELRVLVLPKDASAGKTLIARNSSQMIASLNATSVTLDQDGAATFILGGELPGGTAIAFSVEGTDVTATTKVRVVIDRDIVATPTASIRSGETINSGTTLVLSCATEGATIYYTLDGSCPCDEATRILYDGPITIATDVIVKAIAVKEGMDDSDVATFIYIVSGINNVLTENDVHIESRDRTITITGAEGAICQIYDLQGRLYTSRNHLDNQSRIKVKTAGVYMVRITLNNGQTAVSEVLVK